MVGRKFNFHDGEKGAALAVRIKHSRGESAFSKVLKDGTIVVRLATGEGTVDSRLKDFLARELKIPKKNLNIIAGDTGDNKLVSILDAKPAQIQKLILDRIA